MWKELMGEKISAKQAYRRLTEYYRTKGIHPTVLVVDEVCLKNTSIQFSECFKCVSFHMGVAIFV